MKNTAINTIEQYRSLFINLSDQIWDCPETSFEEHHASQLTIKLLEQFGFNITCPVAGMDTAFTASYGSGSPVIGILGEYDALNGMSQDADVFVHKPLIENGKGHGCGHNLLGSASAAATVAIKKYLEDSQKSGTVIFYGCPAEEGGSGKSILARNRDFDCLDVALTWHPGDMNASTSVSSLANCSVEYTFTGLSAHAAACPHLGRSALDALELMNIGVQFLREHIIPEARVHYAITNAGGNAANVVQSTATSLYSIRAPKATQVKELYERINNIAKGAAQMTDTNVSINFQKSCANLIPNNVLSNVLHNNLEFVSLPVYTHEELNYAEEIRQTLSEKSDLLSLVEKKMGAKAAPLMKLFEGKTINNFVLPNINFDITMSSSTDVGDTSWICPTGQIMTATMAAGTPGHSWQRTAQGKSSIAHKGMLYAGKVMAGAAIDLIDCPKLVEESKEEFAQRMGKDSYQYDLNQTC